MEFILFIVSSTFKKVIRLFDNEEFVKEFEEKKKSIKGLDKIVSKSIKLNIMRKYTKASPDELLFQGVEGLVFNPRVVQL